MVLTVRRPVGEVDDTGAERLGVHKLQGYPVAFREDALPATQMSPPLCRFNPAISSTT
ncbi:MAG: hypothetical protein K0Q96_1715, partial [Rubrobacteraceae bacterium]|nr:hypothetical protein [Rubrobacteraceae bacterium]